MKHHYSYGDVMSSFGQSTSVDPIATSTDSANLCHACECIEEFFVPAMLPWSLIKAGWLVSAGNVKQRCIWSLYCRWLQSLKWEWNQARRCVTYIWLKCTTGLPAGPITTSTFLWLLIVKQISKYWMRVKVLLRCVQMIKCLKRWQTHTTKSVAVPDFRRKAMWLVASGGSRASRPFGAAWGASAPQTALLEFNASMLFRFDDVMFYVKMHRNPNPVAFLESARKRKHGDSLWDIQGIQVSWYVVWNGSGSCKKTNDAAWIAT